MIEECERPWDVEERPLISHRRRGEDAGMLKSAFTRAEGKVIRRFNV